MGGILHHNIESVTDIPLLSTDSLVVHCQRKTLLPIEMRRDTVLMDRLKRGIFLYEKNIPPNDLSVQTLKTQENQKATQKTRITDQLQKKPNSKIEKFQPAFLITVKEQIILKQNTFYHLFGIAKSIELIMFEQQVLGRLVNTYLQFGEI